MTLVLDATVLINFGVVQAFWILQSSPHVPLVIVDEVFDEIRYPSTSVALGQAIEIGWLQRHRLISIEELQWVARLSSQTPRLGSGERASLAACLANGWTLATDDRDARRLARVVQGEPPVAITGTIGLLLDAIEREAIELPAAEGLYRAMIASGFRAPIERLGDLL